MSQDHPIHRIPSIKDREHSRVDAPVYFCCEPVEFDHYNTKDNVGVFMPPFVQEEDDLVGLSIDAFYEKTKRDSGSEKERWAEVQQILALMKRYWDSHALGRKHKMFKKIAVNISASGLSFPSDIPYRAEQLLRLDLFFPCDPFSYVSVVGMVVRSEKAEIGYDVKVHFKDISVETQKEISKFVNGRQGR